MAIPPLTRSIGAAERSMRALLDRELSRYGLSFPHWTALVFAAEEGLPQHLIAQRQLAGRVVATEVETGEAVDELVRQGLLFANPAGSLQQTEKGRATFTDISKAVESITASLYGDLPQADLEATHRTLMEVGNRAARLLAEDQK